MLSNEESLWTWPEGYPFFFNQQFNTREDLLPPSHTNPKTRLEHWKTKNREIQDWEEVFIFCYLGNGTRIDFLPKFWLTELQCVQNLIFIKLFLVKGKKGKMPVILCWLSFYFSPVLSSQLILLLIAEIVLYLKCNV